MVNAIVCQSTMKTFSSQTLISLLTAVGIAQASLRNPIVGVSLIVFILPITLMIIGLTSPKNGPQLDPSGRWYFYVVAKSWAFSLIVLLSFGLFCLALPNYMRDRVVRAVNGDTRRHQLLISFQGERSVRDSLAKKKLTLYDRHGLVGEIRDIGCTGTLQNGGQIESRIWIRVSTDRDDVLNRNHEKCVVEIRSNDELFLSD